jgi:uncharacterized protein YdiU (UPF0061 family)
LRAVIEAQASLIANWMHVGFIHGVMNTDNMAVSGETIDFGPCAFMDSYDPAAVFSSIDRQGRYAYGNQPHAAVWNLARFAETLLPLIDANAERAVELASEALAGFSMRFADLQHMGMSRKLGLSGREEGDAALAQDLLDAMQRNQADFTLTSAVFATLQSARRRMQKWLPCLRIPKSMRNGRPVGGLARREIRCRRLPAPQRCGGSTRR